jgi:hypothetical protein
MSPLRASCCAALLIATFATTARAEPAPAPAADDDAGVSARLAWLEKVLDREEAATRLWRGSWLGIYGGVSLVNVSLLASSTSAPARVSAAVNLGKAGVAFAFTLVSPATALKTPASLGELGETPEGRLARLRRAEALLRRIAKEEREGRSWFPLLGGAALNVGGAWLTWAAYRGSGFAGWFGLLSGFAVGQIQVFTQPTGAIRAQEAYLHAGDTARVPAESGVGLSIVAAPNGVGLRGSF